MHAGAIQDKIDEIAEKMSGRTKVCSVEFMIGSAVEPRVYIRHNPKFTNNWHDEMALFFKVGRDAGTVDDALAEALAWAAALPTREEAELAAFRSRLAETIEHGNRIGVDIKVVNPLMEAMKRLSENAITFQAAA